MENDPRLLLLDPQDNVLTAISPLAAGVIVIIAGAAAVQIETAIPLGHKVAARAIAVGEKIVKYGAPIGSATSAIAPGQHVHLHNVKSDYLPTYRRGDVA